MYDFLYHSLIGANIYLKSYIVTKIKILFLSAQIKFKSHIGDETGDTYIPEKPTITGNCQNEDSATLTLSWEGYLLFWEFAKTPGGERWYVNNIELTVSTDIPAYHNIKAYGKLHLFLFKNAH